MIHAYREVDLDAVWTVCEQDIPPLIEEVETLLRELGVDPGSVP